MRRGAVGVFAAVLLLLATAASVTSASTAASTKTHWRATVAKLPANAATARQAVGISSISCASSGNCSAVGSYIDSAGGQEGLLLSEKAGHWLVGVEAVLPADANHAPDVELTSVFCASPGNCTAVGQYTNNMGWHSGLLVTQTAGHWGAGVEAPLPAHGSYADAIIHSVSCGSAGNCTAVGVFNGSGLVLTEKAGDWLTGVEVGDSELRSVSCAPAGSCSAVGYYTSWVGRDIAAGAGCC